MAVGLDHAAAAFTAPDAAVSGCCHNESPESDSPADNSPCPDPGCSCISCVSGEIPGAVELKDRQAATNHPFAGYHVFFPTGYPRAIDYPPEHS
jgi:hypothetical protein